MSPRYLTPPRSRLVRSFHVLAKPLGSLCNLNCEYCYYLHKQDLLPKTSPAPMSDELLEEFIRQHIDGQDSLPVSFTWHGGEPMLVGLDFYRKIVALQQKHAGTKPIANGLQTNGILLDDEWCRFLKDHEFLVGLSIDGPKHLHDQFRKTKGGEPTFDLVYRAARLLQKYEIPFNTLTVINAVNARHPAEVYRFLTEDLDSRTIQWIPCIEPKNFRTTAPGRWNPASLPTLGSPAARPGHPASIVTDWSVDPDDWGEFLCQTFDLWVANGRGKVFVNWFESLVGQWMRQPPQMCSLAEVCGRSLIALEKDGSLYPCEHFVYPEYKLGNLGDGGRQLADIVYSPQQRKFGCNKRDSLPNYCKQCTYNFACNGECPKNRLIKTPDGQPGLNYLCSGLKRFFTHAAPYLQGIVASIHRSTIPR